MIEVKIIDITQFTVLVEYEDASKRLQRVYLHRELVPTTIKGQPALVHNDYLKQAIPASTVELSLTLGDSLPTIQVRDLQDQLRRAGLWTREDYQKYPKVVHSVVSRIIGIDTTTVLNAAARTPTTNPLEE